jgi:hypothetical protein
MTKAFDLELKKLKARAYDRAEWAEGVLRNYHATAANLNGVVAQQLRKLYDWMFVPPTLWPFNVQDVLEDCLAVLEKGKHLNSRHRLLIPAPTGGDFHLIQQDGNNINCHTVTLPPETILSDESICLHYGSGIREWHRAFVKKLGEKLHGLSIFEGRPGTGKTCYLRHLVGVLKKSHRFYFIPTSTMGVLSKPEFIGFWADQHRIHANRRFVVILEDSDAALMIRGSDNREQVSAILNLSDGMLADFLRLQLICTINCSTADIDPALLRPGRLLCHRVFERLDYPQAARLAESLGRKLPLARDYSLAEVFAGHGTDELNRPRIGFAV